MLFPVTLALFGVQFSCTVIGVSPILLVVGFSVADLLERATNRPEARVIKHL
jgi:hypothetical protein